jgi:TonB family protein
MEVKIYAVKQNIMTEIMIDMNNDDDDDEKERQREEIRSIQQELSREIRSQIAVQQHEHLQNVAVNEEIPKDKKDNVLEENEELQRRIAATYQMMHEQNGDVAMPDNKTNKQGGKQYTGPSVLSYFVKGRKAAYLPVPVYKCEMGGRVTIFIMVTENGNVIDAQIDKEKSTADNCLWQSAVDAALRSKFNVMMGMKQQGSITYQFVSQ